MKKRIISMLLVLAMLFSMAPSMTLAAHAEDGQAHVHNAECGYVEAVEGHACTHVHEADCSYAEAADCTHVHDESCGYAASVEGHECTHAHDADCGYVAASVCTHEHDGDCGYVEAVEGSPCTFQQEEREEEEDEQEEQQAKPPIIRMAPAPRAATPDAEGRVFPYDGYSCSMKGLSAEALDDLLRDAGYVGLKENPVAGEDYCTAGDCNWVFSAEDSNAQRCVWECKTHFGDTIREQSEEGETWKHVWPAVAYGHSGNYCSYCKWTDHEHKWGTDWEFDDTHHWHPCTEDCFIVDFASCEESAYTAHTDGDDDGNCDVCGKHFVHMGQAEWEKDETNHWHKCTVEGCLAKVDEASHNWGSDGICVCGAEVPVVDVSYVYRSWNGSKVGSASRTAEGCIVVTGSTTAFENGKWYVVNENVTVNDRITVNGTAHLILSDGKTLTARAGIHTVQGQTLNIYGQQNDSGALIATDSDGDNAAIGGEDAEAGGTTCIYGGTVTATSGPRGAGIGGGCDGPGGSTTIYGGTVTATGNRGAGIGGGTEGAGGSTTIYGGTVTATGDRGAGIGGGYNKAGGTTTINGGTVTATSNYGAGIGGGRFGSAANVTLGNGVTLLYGANKDSATDSVTKDSSNIGAALNGAKFAKTGAPAVVSAAYVERSWNGSSVVSETKTAEACTPITSGTTTFEDGKWYVVTEDVTVPARIAVNGTAHLILADGAKLTAEDGIQLNNGGKLYIHGQAGDSGQLIANTKNDENPAIGSNARESTPLNVAVIIEGGTITATGNYDSPAIGSGALGGHCDVTINGGRVAATDKWWGAGIGAGPYGAEADITINGGVVNAIGGARGGAAIGSSVESGKSSVIINGGNVTATVTSGDTGLSAAIGSGKLARQGCDVVINGGKVTATGEKGPGIGHGYYTENTGSVTITGGNVTANGGTLSAGIGGPKVDDDNYRGKVNVTITGGIITATGGDKGAGIGGGGGKGSFDNGDSGGTIKIEGGTITASGGSGAAGIGGGAGGSFGTQGAAAEVTLGTGVAMRYGDSDASATNWVKSGDANIGGTLNGAHFAQTGTPPLTHNFTFTIPETAKNTLVATCDEESCSLPGSSLTLTLTANGGEYNGQPYAATHDNAAVKFEETTGAKVGDVVYYSGASQMLNAPTNPGTYKAKLTVTTKTGVKYTLEKEFTISKAPVEPGKVTAPTAKTNLTYTGSAQQLINAGKVIGGTMYYSADYNPETKAGTWDTAVSSITGTNAGSYTVYYKVIGDSLHADVEPTLISNTAIAKKQITVSGIKAENKTYDGSTDAALNYNDAVFTGIVSGEELAVTATGAFANADVGIGKGVTITNITLANAEGKDYAKNYELTATGNQSTATANITKKDITVTITPNGGTYGSVTAASAQLNGLVSGDTTTKATLTYTNQEGTTYYNSTTVPTNAGTYTVTATVSNTNYNLTGTTTADFVIAKAEVTAPEADTTVFTYNKAEQTYTVAENTLYTVSGNKRTVAGSQTVTVALKDKANYVWEDTKTAEDKTFTFTINKAAANLSVDLTFSKTYGDDAFSLGATKDSDATATYAVTDGDAVTVDTTGKVTIAKAGTATITVSVAENSNYLADSKDITVTVAKKQGTLTITNVTYEVTYGDADFTIGEITSEGDEGSAITFTGYDDKVISVDETGKVTIVGAGETTVKVNRENGTNYLAAVEVPVTVKVNPKPATVTPDDKSVTYGDAQAELTYTNTALVGEDTLNVKLTKAGGEDVGEYEITASQEENANPNYKLTFEKGKYTIGKRSITGAEITLDNVLVANGGTQTQSIKSVTVTVGEGKDAKVLPVTYDVTGNTGMDAGSYTLTVTANGNFEGTATKTFVILPAPDSKPATNPDGSVKVGDGSIDVNSSGITLNTDKASVIASVPGNVLTAEMLSKVAGGDNVDIVLNAEEFTPSETDKALVAKKLGSYKVGQYLDVDLSLLVNGTFRGYITELNTPISVSVKLPDSLINTNGDYQRTYAVIRVHGGEAEVLDATFNASTKSLTFKTDRFSTYAVVYKDTWNPKTGDTKTTILWAGVMLLGLMAIGAGIALPNKKRYTGKYRR